MFLPPKDYHAVVEFGNRAAGLVVGLTTLVAAAVAFRVPGMPRWLLLSTVALPLAVLAQGGPGRHHGDLRASPPDRTVTSCSLLVALAIAVVVVLGARDLVRGRGAEQPLGAAWLALALAPAALALVVSARYGDGSLTALGAARRSRALGTPSRRCTCTSARRRSSESRFSPCSGSSSSNGGGPASFQLRLAAAILALLLAQMAVGEVQREGLPWGLVLLHVALATAVWVWQRWPSVSSSGGARGFRHRLAGWQGISGHRPPAKLSAAPS